MLPMLLHTCLVRLLTFRWFPLIWILFYCELLVFLICCLNISTLLVIMYKKHLSFRLEMFRCKARSKLRVDLHDPPELTYFLTTLMKMMSCDMVMKQFCLWCLSLKFSLIYKIKCFCGGNLWVFLFHWRKSDLKSSVWWKTYNCRCKNISNICFIPPTIVIKCKVNI